MNLPGVHSTGLNLFVRKLRHGARLTEDDEAVLTRLTKPIRRVERGDIVPEGAESQFIYLIVEGWAYRYRQLENGKRQITSIFLPGDLCEPFGVAQSRMDHSLGAFTSVILARVPPHEIRTIVRTNPRIEEALWWDLLVSDAVQREHMTSLGRRSAVERLAHFFCETHIRLQIIGLADQVSFDLPLTQADLADMFGLSTVHVNRSLQELRAAGHISLKDRRMMIYDVDALRELSMFNPAYLRLQGQLRI